MFSNIIKNVNGTKKNAAVKNVQLNNKANNIKTDTTVSEFK